LRWPLGEGLRPYERFGEVTNRVARAWEVVSEEKHF